MSEPWSARRLNERRLAILEFDPKVLAAFIAHGSPAGIFVEPDIPDLSIIAVRDGPPWVQRIEVLCHSETFEVVPDNMAPPIIQRLLRVVYPAAEMDTE